MLPGPDADSWADGVGRTRRRVVQGHRGQVRGGGEGSLRDAPQRRPVAAGARRLKPHGALSGASESGQQPKAPVAALLGTRHVTKTEAPAGPARGKA